MSVLFPAERRAVSAQQRTARRKAVDKAIGQYVPLECGHVTTREVTELYKFWAPSHLPFFCEVCDEYRRRQRKPPRKQFPDIPPY